MSGKATIPRYSGTLLSSNICRIASKPHLGHSRSLATLSELPPLSYSLHTKSRQSETNAKRSSFNRKLRFYYTASSPQEAPYPPTESAILAAAISHVPTHGFSKDALTMGAVDAGYLPVTANLFQHGAFDLVLYHLITSRLAIKESVQFPDDTSKPASTAEKVRALLLSRLRGNENVIHKLPEALGLMSLPGNVPSSLRELAYLADEILYLAGDTDVSTSWYTKRATLAGVYASSEMFMTQDQSKNFEDTEKFVERRLEDSDNVAYAAGSIGEWLGFSALSAVNVLRSWGARI